jgi:hypothetical protein
MAEERVCTACGHEPVTRCRRCLDLLCAAHAPAGGSLCNRCEQDYTTRRNGLKLWRWFVIPFALPWLYVVFHFQALWSGSMLRLGGRQFTGHPFSDVTIVTLVAGLLLGGLVAGVRIVLFKHRFVGEDVKRGNGPTPN